MGKTVTMLTAIQQHIRRRGNHTGDTAYIEIVKSLSGKEYIDLRQYVILISVEDSKQTTYPTLRISLKYRRGTE